MPSDLEANFEYGLKLRDLQSATNQALRTVDALHDEIQDAQKSMSALGDQSSPDLVNGLNKRLQQLHTIELKLARPRNIPGYSMGPRLVDRLGALGSSLDHLLAAPTEYQRAYYGELQGEFVTDVGRVNTFLNKDLVEINQSLTKRNGPTLMGGKPVKFPDWLSQKSGQ